MEQGLLEELLCLNFDFKIKMVRELKKLERVSLLISAMRNQYLRRFPRKLLFRIFRDFSNMKITEINGKFLTIFYVPPYPSKAFDRLMMSFINNKNSLVKAHMSVTNKCPYDCEYCSNKYKEGKEMSLIDVKKTIKKLQEKGLSQIIFTGGEPLLRKDLPEIIKSVGDDSVSYIFTSGYGLTEEKARKLKDAGLFGIGVSLDHYKRDVNDKLRGRKGAFETALKTIEISKKVGFYTMVQMVVRKESINDLTANLKFFKKLGVDDVLILEVFPCGKMIGKNDILLSDEEREKIKEIHVLANKRKDFPKVCAYPYIESEKFFGCMGGYNFLYIDAHGEVCPCDVTPLSFGNIVREDFEVIWKRLKKVFVRPHSSCFLLENSDKIKKRFRGKLPLGYKDSKEICKNYCPKISADYYLLMGGL